MLCSRGRHRAVVDSWSRGYRAAVLELELPKAALSPPGRFSAEPPPEGWSSLYPYPYPLYKRERSMRPISVTRSPDVALSLRPRGPLALCGLVCSALQSLHMDAEGPRDGAGCADGRFAELCCTDVAQSLRPVMVACTITTLSCARRHGCRRSERKRVWCITQ